MAKSTATATGGEAFKTKSSLLFDRKSSRRKTPRQAKESSYQTAKHQE